MRLVPSTSISHDSARAPSACVISKHSFSRSSLILYTSSNLTISILTPASSYFLRNAFTFSIETGLPANASTGCDRSSTALTPRSTQRRSTSSPSIMRLPKLYGTFSPICTPATFESGFVAASRRAPGTAASASFPSSRLVISMSLHRFIRNVQPAIDDCKRLTHLLLGDAERRVREERVPPHEGVEPLLAEE